MGVSQIFNVHITIYISLFSKIVHREGEGGSKMSKKLSTWFMDGSIEDKIEAIDLWLALDKS